jgi:hypothetical protein
MNLLCWAIACRYFEIQKPLLNMYSMLANKQAIVTPRNVYAVCSDGMIGAGKL